MANYERSNGVCVRGISSDCSNEMLVQAFCSFGTIVDVFVKQRPRTRRTYAFVTFAKRSEVDAALASPPESVGGENVTVEARTPAPERKVAEPSTNIYIKGLSESTTEEQLQLAVEQFGDVTSLQLSGERGFAFVGFESVEAATAAVNGVQSVGGAAVTVEFRLTRNRRGGGRRGGGGADNATGAAEGAAAGGGRKKRSRGPKPNSVYLKGVPEDCEADEISEALADFGNVVSVTKRPGRDFAFAVFESADGMNAAVGGGGCSVGGNDVTIEERTGGRGNATAGGAEKKERKPRARRARQAPEPNSVYLKGVPEDCEDGAIQDALAGFGNCVSVSHRPGRNFAFAVFESADGMDAAVGGGGCSVDGNDVTIEARTGGN